MMSAKEKQNLLGTIYHRLSSLSVEQLQKLNEVFASVALPENQSVPLKPESNRNLGLKDQPEFIDFVAKNLWETRRDRHWGWKTNVFDFIATVYAPYLGNGLIQSDIRALDRKLYTQFHKELCALTDDERNTILGKLKLPTQADARLEAITDPLEKEGLLAIRAYYRSQKEREP